MKKELRNRIIAFNRAAAEHKGKSGDLDILIEAFAKLPTGQLKKVLSDDVIAVFAKYGVIIE